VTGRVIVLAQDLIWADRLARAVEAAGAEPVPVGSLDRLPGVLPGATAAIVDLTALAYDGIAAIEAARAGAVRVLAVGQHDDHELRKRALAAGAERVYAYRKLFEDGPATIAAFLERSAPVGS
jgi:electron transfer flavoprotein alpha/beta subunit